MSSEIFSAALVDSCNYFPTPEGDTHRHQRAGQSGYLIFGASHNKSLGVELRLEIIAPAGRELIMQRDYIPSRRSHTQVQW